MKDGKFLVIRTGEPGDITAKRYALTNKSEMEKILTILQELGFSCLVIDVEKEFPE